MLASCTFHDTYRRRDVGNLYVDVLPGVSVGLRNPDLIHSFVMVEAPRSQASQRLVPDVSYVFRCTVLGEPCLAHRATGEIQLVEPWFAALMRLHQADDGFAYLFDGVTVMWASKCFQWRLEADERNMMFV